MKCPFCAHQENKVIDSRLSKEGQVIRRRRECLSCQRRFTTYERIEEIMPLVVKKDGRREAFDRQKIIHGLKAACQKRPVSLEQIEEIVEQVERTLQETGEREVPATLIGEQRGTAAELWVRVVVPVTSLCPCSKRISDRGAHNQRSHVTITAKLREHLWIEELIDIAESEASCEVFGILKRPDEKYVTEKAYDNPKFVEDLVRDIAMRLNAEDRIAAYSIEAENFESIHNHSAYALIERDKDAAG